MLRDGVSFGSRPQLYIHFFQRLLTNLPDIIQCLVCLLFNVILI